MVPSDYFLIQCSYSWSLCFQSENGEKITKVEKNNTFFFIKKRARLLISHAKSQSLIIALMHASNSVKKSARFKYLEQIKTHFLFCLTSVRRVNTIYHKYVLVKLPRLSFDSKSSSRPCFGPALK